MNEIVPLPRARVHIHVERAYDFDERRGLWLYRHIDLDEVVENIITDAGRIGLHTFCYGTTPRANGFNWVGISDTASVPAAGDTALVNELTGNGLDRAQGTITLPDGSGNQTTIVKQFTYGGVSPQGVQKAALFNAPGPPPAGVMVHEIQFSQRTLFTNDLITVSYTISLG